MRSPGADAGNYTLQTTSTSAVADITPADLFVTGASAASRVYDGTTTASVTGGGVTLLGGDSVTLSAANGFFADRHVGTNKAVTTAYTLSGPDAGNYTLVQPSGLTATITPADLFVTGASAASRVYDGTTTASVTGGGVTLLGGDSVTLSAANGFFADRHVGTNKAVTTAYTLSGPNAGNYTLVQPNGLTADVTPKSVLASGIRVPDKIFDGSNRAILLLDGLTLSGAIATDDVRLDTSNVEGLFPSAEVAAGQLVTISGIRLAGADAGDYLLSSENLSAQASIIAAPATSTLGLSTLVNVFGTAQTALPQLAQALPVANVQADTSIASSPGTDGERLDTATQRSASASDEADGRSATEASTAETLADAQEENATADAPSATASEAGAQSSPPVSGRQAAESVAVIPQSPLPTRRPPTPVDLADGNDRTLASVAAIQSARPATQTRRASNRSVALSGVLSIEVVATPAPPPGTLLDQNLPTLPNPDRW